MNKVTADDIFLKMTCGACPEQYDAFIEDIQVGYVRLRHGFFYVDFPVCGGQRIYESGESEGDGCFTDFERPIFLRKAKTAIADKINSLCKC